jgi:hypothetical protein
MLPHTICWGFARSLVLLAVLASPALADVLEVPSGFVTIQAAVNAASVGDIVLVAPGTYAESVLVGRGLTIAADGGVVTLRRVEISGLPAGQAVVLDGLVIDARGAQPLLGAGYEEAVFAHDDVGAVRVQDCTLFGEWGVAVMSFNPDRDGFPALRVQDCSSVALLRGSATGGHGGDIDDEALQWFVGDGGAGALIRNSSVALLDAMLTGGDGGTITDTLAQGAGDGGHGVDNKSGSVLVAGCTLTGGDGGNGDCDMIIGCGAGGIGGDGIRQSSASATLWTRGNTYAPGDGGAGGDGVIAPDGMNLDIIAGSSTVFATAKLGFSVNTPVREGQVCTLSFTGPPGAFVWLTVALGPAHVVKPFNEGVYLSGAPLLLQPLGPIVGGTLGVSFTVPQLGAGNLDVTLWLQVLQDTPAAGPTFTFDAAAVLLLLDAGV